jgi:hypothetical protein
VRNNNQPYYDDENLQSIEEYSVVDHTMPTTSDYNNPNTDKSVVIQDESPRYHIEETSTYITTKAGPFLLDRDTVFEAINQIEAGEIVSIELVTDNPYASLYLEMDDYKYKAPTGMTAAELLMKGRNEYSERHFYAENRRPDGSYVIKYHPRKTDKYTDKIKILVRNDIRKTSDFRGSTFSYKSRGSLPNPTHVGFSGGSVLRAPIADSLISQKEFLLAEMLAPLAHDYNSNIPNDHLRTTPEALSAISNPYVGQASKCDHSALPLAANNRRVVFGKPGVAITGTTGANTPDPVAFPGSAHDNNLSEQHILLYATRAELETTAFSATTLARELAGLKTSGFPFYLRAGGTVYYPGKIVDLKYYDDGTSQFQALETGNEHEATDGAILITVSPGLSFKPPNFDLGEMVTSKNAIGRLEIQWMENKILVHEITVNRRKLKSLN